MKGSLNYIDLITFTLYITTFVTPVRKLTNFAEIFTNGLAGLKRFVEVMRIEPSIQEADDAEELTDVRGDITLENVVFGYRKETDVLHGVSLNIRAGESVGNRRTFGRRQEHALPADPAVLRRDGRQHLHRRPRRAQRHADEPAPRDRHRAAGCFPVCRLYSGKHPLRQAGCDHG